MSWSLVTTVSTEYSFGVGEQNIAWPSTPAVNDLAVVCYALGHTSNVTGSLYIRDYGSTSSGDDWTSSKIFVNDTADVNAVFAYKILDADDLVGFTAAGGSNAAYSVAVSAIVLRGAAYNDLVEVVATASGGNSSVADPPDATTSTNGCAFFAAYAAAVNDGAAATPTLPSPFDTNGVTSYCPDGTSREAVCALSYIVQTSSGSLDPGAWTPGSASAVSDSWAASSIAFNVGTDAVTTQSTGVALSGTLAIAGDVEWEEAGGDAVEVAQSSGVALSGTLALSGDVEWGTAEEVAQSSGIALSGTLTVDGDVFIQTDDDVEVGQTAGPALSGTLALSGDVEWGTAEEVAQSSGVALSGTLALAGDVVWAEEGTTAATPIGWMPPNPAKKRAKRVYHIDEDPEPEPEVIEAPEIVATAPDPAVYQSALALALTKAKAAPRRPLRPADVTKIEKRLAPAHWAAQDEEEAIMALLLVL